MRLVVNGEDLSTEVETVKELIDGLRLKAEGVAVEVNFKIIRKKDYGSFRLKEGDRVEVVNFVGGG